jgi:putative sterol carrier protein
MAEFPAKPIEPHELIERWLPGALAEAPLPPGSDALDVKLGIHLSGEGGGEWVVHVDHGRISVKRAPRDEAAFTYVQSVDDWRGALWGGRGGAIGEGAARFFRPGALASAPAGQLGAAPSPAALVELAKLSGLMRVMVTPETGASWSVGFKIGPGAIPADATTTIHISEADAAALGRGELDPMTAFLSGKMKVEGDMTLMLQVQAVQMQAAVASAAAPKS